ncbi:hypothetical protein TPHA_0I01400 [Tetrapisispora phaffii CBS 4417]|uniref:diacylglycerol cholinephosphotransferase n=1 Tax=Tetrapisispora phaffii (strain ATCC 24235 / CBS 4417 / NBRC 1672 / NRRL Y-8282 / UCD 70-5) TaxID=1071381 RepID=G8BXL8_TETPH|nr:hypothetical protein TPHA_0I01400 [Tetrapisispora phaffii CBS 4417]CCE64646.1 hypothetical protein TPHA_0I01400 [Tetrapisispora phaffii CBS 4417]
MGFFVPSKSIENLSQYKYQSEDRSLITKHILKPFWLKFSNVFPLWMAPNVVTLLGFSFIAINVLTALYFDPTLTQGSPRWAYLTYAIGVFMYQTFDACDGIHARRTGQSGPLGELFDHCIDSLNTTLSLIPYASTTRMGFSYMFLLAQFSLLCNFYLSTWEEYHTHKLFLSEFSGPVEGILSVVISFILCAIFGDEAIFQKVLFELKLSGSVFPITTLYGAYVFSTIALMFNVYSARNNVVEYYKGNTENEKTIEKNIRTATIGLSPFFTYFGSIFALTVVEPRFISLPFILTIGLTVAFVVGRIIVNHLTKQKFPLVNVPMLIPSVQSVLYVIFIHIFNYNDVDTIYNLVWLSFGVSLGIHGMFINEIIYEFTTYLDVYALSIKHPKQV